MISLIAFIKGTGAIYINYSNLLFGLFMVVFLPFAYKKRPIIPIKLSVILLIIFGLSYCIFGDLGSVSWLQYAINSVLLYLSGWMVLNYFSYNLELTIKKVIYFISLGNTVHALLNTAINWGKARGTLIDFYTQQRYSDTCAGAINTLVFSIAIMFILENRKAFKFSYLISLIPCSMYALLLADRTTIIILFVVFILFYILYLFEKGNNKSAWSVIRTTAVVAGVFVLLYKNNIFSIKTIYEATNLAKRLQIGIGSSNNVRTERFLLGITNLFKYPFGISGTQYYHNTWLDISRVGGIIPFFAFTLYTIRVIRMTIRVFLNKQISTHIRYILASSALGIFINLFVEPGVEGYLDLFLTFLMINGMTEFIFTKFRATPRNN